MERREAGDVGERLREPLKAPAEQGLPVNALE